MISRHHCPIVIQNFYRRAAHIDHRFDRECHSGLQLCRGARTAIIRNLGFLMKMAPDAVANKFPDHTESIRFDFVLDRRTDLVQAPAFACIFYPFAQRIFGHGEESLHIVTH